MKKQIKKSSSKIKAIFKKIVKINKNFLKRRPHRSFKLTPKSSNYRPLKIEGIFSFSKNVIKTIKKYKIFFIKLLGLSVLASILLVGLMNQSVYNNLRDALNNSTRNANEQSKIETDENLINDDFGGKIYKAGLMFMSTVTEGGLSTSKSESQQLIMLFIFIMVWLSVVWYLRNVLAGNKVSVRDAIYNAGAPIIPMIGIILVIVLQLIPLGLYLLFYSAAVQTKFINGGVESMVFYVIGFLISVLTLYWTLSSFLALIVITIPGVKPMDALRIAGDMSVGRRRTLLFRTLWQILQIGILWAVILIPLILIENVLSEKWEIIKKIPIIPFLELVLSCATFIWTSVYFYLMYRRLLEDESRPA